MQEALGKLDIVVAASSARDTPIYFDILGAPNEEQFEAAVQELLKHCVTRGYTLAHVPRWEEHQDEE